MLFVYHMVVLLVRMARTREKSVWIDGDDAAESDEYLTVVDETKSPMHPSITSFLNELCTPTYS